MIKRRVDIMQLNHNPIQINQKTAKLILGNMNQSNSSSLKKAFVKESIRVASQVKSYAVRING
jgi:hypothetical protein